MGQGLRPQGDALLAELEERLNERAERYAEGPFAPVEVRAYLRSPLILDPLSLHLDGILAYAVLADEGFPVWDSNQFDHMIDIPLPLLRDEVWHASAVWVEEPAKGRIVIYKRWEVHYEHLVRKRRKINTGSGFFRAVALPYYTTHAPMVRFWALGNPEEILRLLREHVPAIGKKRHVGYGAVLEWEVRPARRDMSVYRQVDDMLLSARILPTTLLRRDGYWAKGMVAPLAIRPPYWHPDNVMDACFPWQELVIDTPGIRG